MKGILNEKFGFLSTAAVELILEQTIQEIEDGVKKPHSIQTLHEENRLGAIGSRMTSKPLLINQYDNNLEMTGESFWLDGSAICNMFINSCKQNPDGFTYYPLSSLIPKDDKVKQLRLFVKDKSRYECKAVFDILERIETSEITYQQAKYVKDPSIIKACRYNMLLKIGNVCTENLPSDYLSKAGESVYKRTFKGSNPNVILI